MKRTVTIKSRLVFVIGFLSLLLISGGVVGLGSLHRSNDSLETLYDARLVPMGQLDVIVRNIDRDRMAIAEAINNDPGFIAKRIEDVKRRAPASRDAASRSWLQRYAISRSAARTRRRKSRS
jgi:hypothetical protein